MADHLRQPPSSSPLLSATMETLSLCPLHHCPRCSRGGSGMRCVRRWSSGVAVCLLHTLLWTWTGAIEPAPKIDGRRRSAVTLRENMTHRFICQSDGSYGQGGGVESAQQPAPPPLLTWYLNGERQRQPFPERGRLLMTPSSPPRERNSSFSLLARKSDRELVCTAANPSTGESANATVTLNVLCAIEPAPKIDGRRRSAVTLRENMTHRFICQSDGSYGQGGGVESAQQPAPPPLLTWYLNGERQRQPFPERGRLLMTPSSPPRERNSSFSLLARKSDRELVCTAANPSTGESANATVTLNVLCAIEPAPKIDGRRRSAVTLRENMTHRFICQSDGSYGQGGGVESAQQPAPPPLLTWYLNGERQRQPFPERGRLLMTPSSPPRERNSSFSLLARKSDRELVCTAANPSTGESANATVTLNVLFEPEILRVNAHYSSEPSGDPSGVSLVLFALVRSNPPATVTFMDQSGRAVANASSSHFLVLDSSHSYPSSQLANHTLRLTLSSLSGWGNVTLNASNSVGAAQSNLTLTEFLLSSVEVPMLGIVTGGGMAFMALLILSLIVLCLTQKTKAKAIDEPVEILLMTKKSDSSNLKPEKATKAKLPRENMSLPSNMQLNDLNALRRAREAALQQQQCMQQCMLGDRRKRREEVDDEDLSAAYAARGFSRYPMVGYVYKVSSTSSEEIWL